MTMQPGGAKQREGTPPLPWGVAACAALLASLAALPAAAAEEPATNTGEVITNPAQVWPLSTEAKSVAHRIRFEGRVSFYDPRWHNSWLETDGVGTYIKLSPTPPDLRAGQYVRIEGSMIPLKGLAADAVTVTVFDDYKPIEPLATKGRIRDFNALGGKIVTLDGYVDGQQLMDGDHVRLAMVVEDRPIIGWIKPDAARPVPDWQGKFVRLVGLFSGRLDSTGTDSTIEIWVSRQRDVTVLGALATDASFDRPLIRINEIPQTPPGEMVRIRGRVQAHEPGSSIVVRDDTGQVEAQSLQQQRLPFDTEIDVVGRTALMGSEWILQSALYRKTDALAPASQAPAESAAVLKTVEQIRELSPEEATRGHSVAIAGTVVWARPGRDFFFLQDVTGSIRVRFPREKMDAPPLVAYILVEGVTYNSGFSPAVELKSFKELGAMSPQAARPVSFEQAITGKEDGQWVEMRGFYRQTVSEGERRLIHVTTPAGEFVAELESPVDFEATPGSLINLQGVCSIVTDGSGRIAGLTLLVPFLHGIAVEENAPADLYNLPLRSIQTLAQLSTTRDMMRVRVAGTVVHAVPGQLIYLQENDSGLLVLSDEKAPLAPGDVVEAVGILGREGARILLREAVCRKRGPGPAPDPLLLADPARLATSLDARLVRVRGTLLDALRRPEHVRLTLQAGNTLFEALLDPVAGETLPPSVALGAVLDLTGVYKSVVDDARQLRGFQLQLRSPLDVGVVQKARFWTAERALMAAGVLAGCFVLGLAWITALRRRVSRQTEQIRRQLEHQARLEAEVQRAARLESLGVLAGGIAHDFNNLLTIIMGNLGLAMLDEKTKRAAGDYLREIERGALRARDLTQQLLTFAKGGDPLRTTVSLPEIVHQAAEFVLHGSSVRCDYTTGPGLWNANVDKDQITQVVQNIVLNSVQAMPHGGVIKISLANEEMAEGAKTSLAAGRYIRLAIADPGEGIGPDLLPRIFDPYFTTKKTGSGLGLATVYSIVKKHKGRIEVDSTPGRGTTLTLWLPAAGSRPPQPSASPAPPPVASASPIKSARVLLMDDEESIRRLGTALLQRIGLEPTAVADGAEAVRVFSEARSARRPFDLIILDLTIPGGMGGKETVDLIRKIDPAVPAIVSSGYSSDPVLADFRSYGFQAMVAKPYEISQLTGAVKQLLVPRA